VNQTRQYRTLILGGYGSIGRAFFLLGGSYINTFNQVVVLDRKGMEPHESADAMFLRGDIEDLSFLANVLRRHAGSFLFVNLCSLTDTYRIRQKVSYYDGAYIDTSCSTLYGADEHRYSRLMPHTFKPTRNAEPHFTCCGVNPGMVEVVARKIIQETFDKGACLDILFFENDQFHAQLDGGRVGVSWSPDTLIDEVMLTPTFSVRASQAVECEQPPTLQTKAQWGDRVYDARLVGHEELWNVRHINSITVENSFFAYTFHDTVMDVLRSDADLAHGAFIIPDDDTRVFGTDTLAVKVIDTASRKQSTLAWETDHAATQKKWGINGVQFQVASSLLFFLELLVRCGDWSEGKVLSASDIPLEWFGWDVINELLDRYGIDWREANELDLRLDAAAGTGLTFR
jgi:hypothetical protein